MMRKTLEKLKKETESKNTNYIHKRKVPEKFNDFFLLIRVLFFHKAVDFL